MDMPPDATLTPEQMDYIKRHPFLSYLMVAHEPTLSQEIKHNILNHHRPRYEDENDNNYPNLNLLLKKLRELAIQFQKDPAKQHVARDIVNQLQLFKQNRLYDEDASIITIASEFASLTSDVSWRTAFSPERAVKMIINNSFFTYPGRIMREFLDNIAISLCDNRKILREGDFIVVGSETFEGSPVFEACRIESVGRYQSRPGCAESRHRRADPEKAAQARSRRFRSRFRKIGPSKSFFRAHPGRFPAHSLLYRSRVRRGVLRETIRIYGRSRGLKRAHYFETETRQQRHDGVSVSGCGNNGEDDRDTDAFERERPSRRIYYRQFPAYRRSGRAYERPQTQLQSDPASKYKNQCQAG